MSHQKQLSLLWPRLLQGQQFFYHDNPSAPKEMMVCLRWLRLVHSPVSLAPNGIFRVYNINGLPERSFVTGSRLNGTLV